MNTWKHIAAIGILFLTGLAAQAQILPNLGGQRTGSSALSYLKNDASPRSLGMASSNVTLRGDGFTSFTNPAAITSVSSTSIGTSNLLIGNGINQTFLSVVQPWEKRTAAFALTVNNLSSGRQEVRTEFQPHGTGEYFYVVNTAIGLGISKQLSDQFSFGLKLNYIHESIAQYQNNTFTADLGFLYQTDVRDLSFAVVVSNFGGSTALSGDFQELKFNQNSTPTPERYPVPTVFKLGISMYPIQTDKHELLAAVQLNHPNDNSENISMGLEYGYRKLVFVRAGYVLGRKSYTYPTFGAGFKTRIGHHPLHIQYAFVPTTFFGVQHHIGLNLRLYKPEERKVESNGQN
ncbi:PorV/PorQ family protein [bacterium SCSIO 12741]|nr:PorV/PorQ family protein [bacterium SCSIO 12741]